MIEVREFAHVMMIRRIERGWSQTRLAQEVGVSRISINLWEKQKVAPQFHLAQLIAQALEFSLDGLTFTRRKRERRIHPPVVGPSA